MTQAGSPNLRNDRICITSLCPRQLVCSRCQRQLRFSVSLATNHDCPGHPCNLAPLCVPTSVASTRAFSAVIAASGRNSWWSRAPSASQLWRSFRCVTSKSLSTTTPRAGSCERQCRGQSQLSTAPTLSSRAFARDAAGSKDLPPRRALRY